MFLIGGTSAPLAGSILRAIAIRITGNDHLVGQMLAPLVLNQQDNKNAYNSFSDPLHRYKSENTLIFFEEVILSGKKLKGFLSKYAKHRFYSFISSIDFRKEIYSWEDLYTLKQISPDITYLSQEQKKCVEIFNISQEKSDLFYLIRRLSLLSNLYYGVLVPILFSELEQENGSLDSSLEAPSFFSQALDKYVPVSSKDISDTVRNNLIEAGKIIDIFQNIILK